MKKIRFVFVLLFFVPAVYSQGDQKNNLWDIILNDVKVRYAYSLKYDALLPKPRFGKKIKALEGEVVTLQGFFLPLDITGDIFVLSYNPSKMCFFCAGAGIESIIELNPKEDEIRRFKRLKTDSYFEVKGRLRLNAADYEHLIYILDEVEFIKLIFD